MIPMEANVAPVPPGSLLDADHPENGVRPWGWTVSSCGLDHVPGVLILELYRAQISERGVEPACVVQPYATRPTVLKPVTKWWSSMLGIPGPGSLFASRIRSRERLARRRAAVL